MFLIALRSVDSVRFKSSSLWRNWHLPLPLPSTTCDAGGVVQLVLSLVRSSLHASLTCVWKFVLF
jgi:hypothetical protein